VIYEAARRLPQLLSELTAAFGHQRRLAVVREATKTHEEIRRGNLSELAQDFMARPALGEVTLVIEGVHDSAKTTSIFPLDDSRLVGMLCEAGMSLKDASAIASKITGGSRRQIYQAALKSQQNYNEEQ
jgi:16S rRNA (cytidine1402-2'-O)-methyltransferase